MRSRHRLTYTQVGALIESPDSPAANKVRSLIDDQTFAMLWQYFGLYQALRDQRDDRGAIDFETTETRILYDDQKKIQAIVPVQRNVAHKMIEEAMLAANICAARFLEQAEVPALFRNHEPPTAEKLEALQQFLGPLGLKIDWGKKSSEPSPMVFRHLTEDIATRPDRDVIQTVMLRSLKQAKYEAENKGHFGLAYKAYTHFTSPIRRYPDLLVHRAIRYLIRSGEGGKLVANPGKLAKMPKSKILPYSPADMVALGEHCSLAERRADEASRDVVQWLKCQYMEQHLGDTFEGVISAVTSFGLFVQLTDLYIEGLVHISSLDNDYYHHDDIKHALVGESSGRRYRLGDTLAVKVAAVHTEDRKIDLALGDAAGDKRSDGKPGKGSVRAALAAGKFPGKEGKRSTESGKQGGKAPAKGKKPAAKAKTSGGKGPPRGRKASRRR